MKNSRSGEKVKLTSIDELLGVVNEESAMEIEIKSISPFKGHPFKVIADDKMEGRNGTGQRIWRYYRVSPKQRF